MILQSEVDRRRQKPPLGQHKIVVIGSGWAAISFIKALPKHVK